MPQMLTRDCLSSHDQEVLESIFNPLELTSSLAPAIIDPNAGADLVDIDEESTDAATVLASKTLEVAAVKSAEQGHIEAALNGFTAALAAAPTRPSVYNNRAQALRLAGRDDDALADLNKALELCTTQLKTKCHAHCQRGVLYRKKENLDSAREDFEEAAKLGSQFAKTQLVEINPYAALCNQMLRQAFEQLK